jgi:cyclic beta-1,2-glucan synthetase
MYRVGTEAILGITLERGALRINPCIPRAWPQFEARLRTPHAELQIVVENPAGVCRGVVSIELDGVAQGGPAIKLEGLTGPHAVRVVLGTA